MTEAPRCQLGSSRAMGSWWYHWPLTQVELAQPVAGSWLPLSTAAGHVRA